jgi:hypothetical protein
VARVGIRTAAAVLDLPNLIAINCQGITLLMAAH